MSTPFISSVDPSGTTSIGTSAAVATGAFGWLAKAVGFGVGVPAMSTETEMVREIVGDGGGIEGGSGNGNGMVAEVEKLLEAIITPAEDMSGGGGGGGGGTMLAGNGIGQPGGGGFSFGSRGSRGIRGVGNIFNYLTSYWALLCIFMAIMLNRTLLYASLRRPTRLPFRLRLVIRIVPILLFLGHIRSILYALRCQTSPYIPLNSHMHAARIPYTDEDAGGFLYYLSRIFTPWLPSSESDVAVCQSFGMLPSAEHTETIWSPTGSLSILWPLYRTISISLFLSTFSHALQGPTTAGTALPSTSSDTGLTLFEDSLAFAEAEALVDPQSGNVSPEVLYIALISAFAHLTANIISLFLGDQPRHGHHGGWDGAPPGVATVGQYRLITTGIWGVAFLGGFTWALFRGGAKVLGFPTVCVVGFIPHLMVVVGIATCGAIYLLAAIFSTLVPPDHHRPMNRRGRRGRMRRTSPPPLWDGDDGDGFHLPSSPSPQQLDGAADPGSGQRSSIPFLDFSNLHANITLSTLSVSWSEDFYTTLLKLGYQCLTAASQATYLNEGLPIRVPGLTWLERERIKVLERQKRWEKERERREKEQRELSRGGVDPEVRMYWTREGGERGYANERKEVKGWMVGLGGNRGDGDEGGFIGGEGGTREGGQRRGGRGRKITNVRASRWVGAVELISGIVGVLGRWGVRGAQEVLSRLGIIRTRAVDGSFSGMGRGRTGRGTSGGREGRGEKYASGNGEDYKDGDEDEGEDELDAAALQVMRERWVDDDSQRQRLYAAFLIAKVRGLRLPDSGTGQGVGGVDDDGDAEYIPDDDEHPDDSVSSTSALSVYSGNSARSGSSTPTQESVDLQRRYIRREGYGGEVTGEEEEEEEEEEEDEEGEDEEEDIHPLAHLAPLLDPKTQEDRDLARVLAQHISAQKGVVTRAKALSLSSSFPSSSSSLLSPHSTSAYANIRHNTSLEEGLALHTLLLDKRPLSSNLPTTSSTTSSTSTFPNFPEAYLNLDQDPQWALCVICHTSPRTVVVWPCRCLALCEECRVTLAVRNFRGCVCCRREVGGVSRVFVV